MYLRDDEKIIQLLPFVCHAFNMKLTTVINHHSRFVNNFCYITGHLKTPFLEHLSPATRLV